MRKKRAIQLILTLFLVATLMGTVYGAFLTYKSYVEIYGTIHPLGIVEVDIQRLQPIEGLETREDYIGEIRVWTYSNDTELILQLVQLSQVYMNFQEFTIKVCLPLDMIFVIDLTGSMSQYMDKIKEQLTELVTLLSLNHDPPLRFGVVGFKDYPAETQQLPLTDDYEAVKAYIDTLTAVTGNEEPQGHYLGLQAALNDFKTNSALANDKVIIFLSDAEAGYNDEPSFEEAKAAADEIAKQGIKINAFLCGGDYPPENEQLQYYAYITGGQYIGPPKAQDHIVNSVIGHPTWKVTLTPVWPFDSFQLRLNSSPPCQQEGYYTFYVYLSFWANADPSHKTFFVELMANLEKGQSRWPSNPEYDFEYNPGNPGHNPGPDPDDPDPPPDLTGLAKLQDELINATANTVYFIYQDPKTMWRPQSAFDVMSGGIVYALCTNPQNQGFNTTKHWLLPTGAINTTTINNAAIAMFGGSGVHVSVKHYIFDAELTPVKEAWNSTHVWFANRTDAVLAALPWGSLGTGHEDFFVIETFTEGNNIFLVMYGMDWIGTWAAGMYFKEVIHPNLETYTDNYYIFHWIDDSGQDGVPQISEITQYTSG